MRTVVACTYGHDVHTVVACAYGHRMHTVVAYGNPMRTGLHSHTAMTCMPISHFYSAIPCTCRYSMRQRMHIPVACAYGRRMHVLPQANRCPMGVRPRRACRYRVSYLTLRGHATVACACCQCMHIPAACAYRHRMRTVVVCTYVHCMHTVVACAYCHRMHTAVAFAFLLFILRLTDLNEPPRSPGNLLSSTWRLG